MNVSVLLWATGKAFIVSLALTPIVRDVFRAYNVVDRPGRRKVHAFPIPRVGGVAIMAAYLVGMLSFRGPGSPFPAHWIRTILSGAVIMFLVGLLDDFVNLKPRVKLLGQIAAACAAFASGIQIERFGGIELPVWISLPATLFWLLLTTNALNLIDGLDGLCAGIGFWATLAFFAAAVAYGDPIMGYTVLPLSGALLGFLFFNFNPATVFLGDSGALLTGFLLGCFGIIWSRDMAPAVSATFLLSALCVPMLDLGLSIVRRQLNNQPIFSADRGHIHHRLLDLGLTVRRAAFTLYAAEIIGSAFGLTMTWLLLRYGGPGGAVLSVLVAVCAAAAVIVGISRLRYAEFEVAGRLFFGGGMRNILAREIRIRRLEISLEAVKTPDEWWSLVTKAAREEKWGGIRWIASDNTVRETALNDRRPSWSFSLNLGGEGIIEVEGDETAAMSGDLVSFSIMLKRSLRDNRRGPE
jgi:UDP-GlcNAc:undecaprenyl-phosphate GlcNAc-1-phosphate transferase